MIVPTLSDIILGVGVFLHFISVEKLGLIITLLLGVVTCFLSYILPHGPVFFGFSLWKVVLAVAAFLSIPARRGTGRVTVATRR